MSVYYDPLSDELIMSDPNKAGVDSEGNIELTEPGIGIIFVDETLETEKKQYLDNGVLQLEDI